MTIILGFGSTEQEFVAGEARAIRERIEQRFGELGLRYFTDAFAQEIREWVDARGKALREQDARYKNADEYPDRYSFYSTAVLSDANYIVVILNLFHTNRRHALSSDGWAAMTERAMLVFDVHAMADQQEAA